MNHHSLMVLWTVVSAAVLAAWMLFDVVRTLRLARRSNVGRDKTSCLFVTLVGSFVAVAAVFWVTVASDFGRVANDVTQCIAIGACVILLQLHRESISVLLSGLSERE